MDSPSKRKTVRSIMRSVCKSKKGSKATMDQASGGSSSLPKPTRPPPPVPDASKSASLGNVSASTESLVALSRPILISMYSEQAIIRSPNTQSTTSTRSNSYGFGSSTCSCETCADMNDDQALDRGHVDGKGSDFVQISDECTMSLSKTETDPFVELGPGSMEATGFRGVSSETFVSFSSDENTSSYLDDTEVNALRQFKSSIAAYESSSASDKDFNALPKYADVEYDAEYNPPFVRRREPIICASASTLPISESTHQLLIEKVGEEAVESVWYDLFKKRVDINGELVDTVPATKRTASSLSGSSAGVACKKRRVGEDGEWVLVPVLSHEADVETLNGETASVYVCAYDLVSRGNAIMQMMYTTMAVLFLIWSALMLLG